MNDIDLRRQLAAAKDKIEEFEERERQRKRLEAEALQALPRKWHLTRNHRRFILAMLAHPKQITTRETLLAAIDRSDAQLKHADSIICVLRKRLKPFGIVILTERGLGYRIAEHSLAAVQRDMNSSNGK